MFGTNQENINKSIIALMLQLARNDGWYHERDFLYILHVGQAMGVFAEDIRLIQSQLDDYNLILPKDESERMTILYYLLFCMKADGKITEKETLIIQKMGFRLGFRPELVNDLIRSVSDYINSKLPPELLLNKVKTYLN